MPDLEKAGFEAQLVLNHDGHFDDFLSFVRKQGVSAAALPLEGLPAPQRSFDESRVYEDLAVLSRWMEARRKSKATRVAAYYNTISLHDDLEHGPGELPDLGVPEIPQLRNPDKQHPLGSESAVGERVGVLAHCEEGVLWLGQPKRRCDGLVGSVEPLRVLHHEHVAPGRKNVSPHDGDRRHVRRVLPLSAGAVTEAGPIVREPAAQASGAAGLTPCASSSSDSLRLKMDRRRAYPARSGPRRAARRH